MLTLIRILAILLAAFFVLIVIKEQTVSLAIMLVALGVFIIFNVAFVVYHPFIGLIAMLSLISIGVLFVVDTKMEIEKYQLRRVLYPLLGIYTLAFFFEVLETIFGRFF